MTKIMVAPIDEPDGALFGYGIDQLTGNRVPISCVQNLPDPTIGEPSDSGDHMQTLVVQDSASYSQLMSNVATLSASGISWSASASVSYLREQASSDTSITLTWTRFVRTQDRRADFSQAKISPAALDLLKAQGVDAFLAKYGTHCIIGIAYGGSFAGYSRIETQSVSDKQTLQASISGSLSGFGMHGSVSDTFEHDLQSSNVEYTSSQDTNVIGADPIPFTGLDLTGMQNAVRTFAPTANHSLSGIDGAPIGLICVSWDEFADIANALDGDVSAIGLGTVEHALTALSSEYSALTYVASTAAKLQNSPAIIPAYAPLLTRIGNQADTARNAISNLGIEDVNTYATSGTGTFVIAATLQPQVAWIGKGYGQIEVTHSIDVVGFCGDLTDTSTKLVQPGGGEQNLGQFERLPAINNECEILTLLYTFDRDANGIPYIAARMHLQNPFASGAAQQQDLGIAQQLLNQTTALSCTATWPNDPTTYITVTLVPPTG